MTDTAEVIETDGVVTEESQERIRPEDIPVEDVPVYSIAAAIEWSKRPENQQALEQWSGQVKAASKRVVAAIDRDVSKVGRLLIEMGTDNDILQDVKDSFLRSIAGIED